MAKSRQWLLGGVLSVILAVALVASLLISLELRPAAAAEDESVATVNDVLGENFLRDPGFEALTPEGYKLNDPWDIYCAKEGEVATNRNIIINNDATRAHTGSSYLKIGVGGWTGIAQKIRLTPGDYRLSVFAKGMEEDVTGSYNKLNFSVFYNEGTDIGYLETDTIGTTVNADEISENWNEFSRIFRVDVEKDFVVRVGVNGTATIALDDFSLEKLAIEQDTDGNNLFVNGGMELNADSEEDIGDPFGWSFYGAQHGRDYADMAGGNRRNNNSYFGKGNLWFAMDIAGGAGEPELRAAYQTVTVTENTTYKVSAFVRNWGIPQSDFIIGMQTEQDGVWQDVATARIPSAQITVAQKNVAAYFTTGAGVTSVRFYLGGMSAVQDGAGYSFDEVSVKEVSDVDSVALTLPQDVTAGSYAQAEETVMFANGETGFDSAAYAVVYTSTNTNIAEISNDGRITAKVAGTTDVTVTVTSNITGTTKTATETLTVGGAAALESLFVSGEHKVMLDDSGKTLTLTALMTNGNEAIIDASMVSFEYTDDTIVTLTAGEAGTVTIAPLKAGTATATITVTSNEVRVEADFEIEVVTLESITIDMDEEMMQTNTQTITVNALLTDGTLLSNVDAALAIVESTEGAPAVDGNTITAENAMGEFTLRATVELYGTEKSAEQKFEVIELSELDTVKLSLDYDEVATGEYAYPRVEAKTESGATVNLDNAIVTYTITDENVATEMVNRGETAFFGIGAGETTITVTVEFGGKSVTSNPVTLSVTGSLIRDGGFETNYAGDNGNANDYWQAAVSGGATDKNYGYDLGGFGRTGMGNIFVRMPNGEEAWTFEGTVRLWQDIELEADAYTLSAYIKRFPGEEGSGKFGGDVWFEAVLLDAQGQETETKFISEKNDDAGVGQFDPLSFGFEVATAGTYRIYIVAESEPANNTGIGFQMDDVSMLQGKVPTKLTIMLGDNEVGDYALKVGDTSKISAKALYEDGTEAVAERIRLSFEVDDGSIATVSKDGTVFALDVGETEIKVTADVDGVSIVQSFTLIVEEAEGETPGTPSEEPAGGCSGNVGGTAVGIAVVVLAVGSVLISAKKRTNK